MNFTPPADDDAARSERNAERLRDLALARRMTMQMMARLADDSGVLAADAGANDVVKDPFLTMSRLQLGLCRIVALEQRLDESAEMRIRRLADEDAERQAAAAKTAQETACLARDAARQETAAKKTLVRKAVRNISFDMDAKMTIAERENLLDGLFVDFEAYKDYADDPAAIVVELCCDLAVEMGCIDPMEPGGLADLPKDATHEQRYGVMKALAQSYLDEAAPYPPAPEPERAESG